MATDTQARFSTMVDAKLRAAMVKKDGVIFNNRYEGDAKGGAVKIPVRDAEATVNAYDRSVGAELTHAETQYITCVIDKDYAVNELIDGFDAASAPDSLVADRLDSAGFALAMQMEKDAAACLEEAATVYGDNTACTAENAYDLLVDARKALSKANVPWQGRWLLASPDFYAMLLKDREHFTHATQAGDSVVANGSVGRIAGFDVYEDATLSEGVEFIAGHPDWCCRVREWQTPVQLNDLTGSGRYIGASAVQGRKVYAHKVTKPQTLLIKKASV